MKTTRIIIYLALIAIIISCSSNSDLLGSWQVDRENSTLAPGTSAYSITFKSDGSFVIDDDYSGEYKLNEKDNIITMHPLMENGKPLPKHKQEEIIFKIIVLTKITLKVNIIIQRGMIGSKPIEETIASIIFKRL